MRDASRALGNTLYNAMNATMPLEKYQQERHRISDRIARGREMVEYAADQLTNSEVLIPSEYDWTPVGEDKFASKSPDRRWGQLRDARSDLEDSFEIDLWDRWCDLDGSFEVALNEMQDASVEVMCPRDQALVSKYKDEAADAFSRAERHFNEAIKILRAAA